MENRQLQDIGLLVLRVGIGIMFIIHGAPKLFGGPEAWANVGGMGMGSLGIEAAPAFWGFIAAFAECVGGLALIVGFLTRPFCILLAATMLVAAIFHFSAGTGVKGASHAIEMAIVFSALLIAGPGKLSMRQMIDPFKRKWFI